MTRKEFLEILCGLLTNAKDSEGFNCFPCICGENPLACDSSEVDKVLASKVFVAVDNVIMQHRMSREVVLETQARAVTQLQAENQTRSPSLMEERSRTIKLLGEQFNCSISQAKDAYDRHGY